MSSVRFLRLNSKERVALKMAIMYPHKSYKEILPKLFMKDFPGMSDATYRKYHKEGIQSLIGKGLLNNDGNPTINTYSTISGPLATQLIGDASREIYSLLDMYEEYRDKCWDYEKKIREYEEKVSSLNEERNSLKAKLDKKDIVHYKPVTNLNSFTKEEIEIDMKEAEICVNSGAYKAGITMCGRAVEVTLHSIYEEKTGSDLSRSGIGLGKLIGKMREENIDIPEEITRIANFINDMRVISIHKREKLYLPSVEETTSIFELTNAVLRKLYKS